MLFADDPATAKMNEFLNGISVIAQTPETWQVDWTETVRDRQGFVKVLPYRMRALVTTYVTEPAPDISENKSATTPWAFT